MTSLKFSRPDVERLAGKLAGKLAGPEPDGLSSQERNLLLAIFSVARERVSDAGPPIPENEASEEPSVFSKQLVDSFLPDSGTDFILPPRHGGVQPGYVGFQPEAGDFQPEE